LTGTWGSIASLPVAAACGGLVCIGSSLYFYGGIGAGAQTDLSNTWAYDLNNPSAGWTARAAMPNARNHIGYAAINGLAYAVGGTHLYNSTGGNVSEVDAFNPVTNTWTQVASLPMPVGAIHCDTLVVNGKIVVLGGQTNGGYDGTYLSTIEEYDPVGNAWTNVGSLPEPNEGQSDAYINDELIVVDGTVDNQGGWAQDETLVNGQISL
jgi:N-acetylneuraminic acid mutarotase